MGSGERFLAHKTTMKNIVFPSHPTLFDRQMYGTWEAAESKDVATVANEKAADILKIYKVAPINADILKDMETIVKKADDTVKASL